MHSELWCRLNEKNTVQEDEITKILVKKKKINETYALEWERDYSSPWWNMSWMERFKYTNKVKSMLHTNQSLMLWAWSIPRVIFTKHYSDECICATECFFFLRRTVSIILLFLALIMAFEIIAREFNILFIRISLLRYASNADNLHKNRERMWLYLLSDGHT